MSLRLLGTTVATVLVCAACSSSTSSAPAPPVTINPNAPAAIASEVNEVSVRTSMHDAFEDEAQWSRLYVVQAFGGTGDLTLVGARLMSAEDAVASAMGALYGAGLENQLRTLLRTRASDLVDIVAAQRGTATKPQLRAAFMANEDAIAQLMRSYSPRLDEGALAGDLRACSQSTFDQVDARSRQAWRADADAYESALGCEIGVADLLTDAMTSQFGLVQGPLAGRAEEIYFSLRVLLDDDVLWTRAVLAAQSASGQDGPAAADKAVSAANGVGSAFDASYGEDVGLEVGRQMHQVTITDALAYMIAAQSGETAAEADLAGAWAKDAAALALYLGNLSPAFDGTTLARTLGAWVAQSKAGVDARLARDWQADVDAYAAMLGAARTLSFDLAGPLGEAPPASVANAVAAVRPGT